MEIFVNLEFGDGNFESGFDKNKFAVTFVTLPNKIAQLSAQLSPNTEIPLSYEHWKYQYYALLSKNARRGFTNNQVTHISERDCRNEALNLRHQMHQWLQPLKSKLSSVLRQYPDSEIRLIIHTQKVTSSATKDILHRLPWHEWDFFTEDLPSQNYTKEAALCFNYHTAKTLVSKDESTTNKLTTDESAKKIRRARIISIFGNSQGIDTHTDKELLQKLKKRGTELISLTEPSRADFNMLWEEPCDILFFAGHSETQNDIQNDTQTGVININPRDSLSLTDIKKTLSAAIANGLKLAIFNSCDGLGLARDLAELNLGYIIVWREVVPDIIAQKFIGYFLSSFASGKSLFTSVGEARDKLLELADEQDLQNQLPGITWLPVICQNTTEAPPTWSDLGGLTGELPDNPYRGLSAFREEDAAFYFGREKFIASLREAVNNQPLVAVIGASGSGKSSVVFAGLLPKLRNVGNIGIVSFRPENKPFDNLAVALSDISDKSILQHRKVRSKINDNRLAQIDLELDWHDDETKLCDVIQTLISSSKYQRLVLVADQFEELYTLTPETERQSFLKALYFTIKYAQNFTLVLTLRADFLGIVLNSLLGKALQEHTPLLLTPMEREELRDAIEKPALKMKVELQSGLTNKLIDDLGSHPGRLPLLEFALTQLWEKQENWYLTHQAYDEIGGLEKALAKHADEVLDALQLQDLDNRYKAEQIFIQLVSPGAGTEDTRRVATRQDVGDKNWDLVQKLADKRLVVTGRDDINKVETVEIVHEALIREWGTFRKWIENNREFRVWQERLKQDEREWEKNNQNPDSLLQGTALSVAEDWYKQRGEELTDKECDFIKKSITQRNKQQHQQKFRRNLTIFSLVMGLLVVSFFAGISEIRRNDAELRQLSSQSVQRHDAGDNNEALVDVIKAAQKLQRNIFSLWAEPDTKIEVISALQSQLDFQPTVITHNPKGHTGDRYGSGVNDVIVSRDCKTLASVGEKALKLWDVATGTNIHTYTGQFYNAIFSNDGKTLASASYDNTVKLWDVATGTSIYTLKGHTGRVLSVLFSNDGKTLASASYDKTVKLWDVATGTSIYTLKGHKDSVSSVIFSNDGKTLASVSDGKIVKLWDVATGNSIKTLKGHTGRVNSVIFSNDGKTLASLSDDKTVKLWDVATGNSIKTLKGHAGRVNRVIFSNDDKTLASASDDKTVKLWDVATGNSIKTFEGHTSSVTSVIFSNDSKTLASVSDDKTVKLWDATTGASIKTLEGRTGIVTSVIFSSDGKTLASVSDNNTVKLWDAATGISVKTLKVSTDRVTSVIFSNDGKTLASVSDSNTIKLWDAATGNSIKTLKGDTDRVTSVIFSNDGKTFASAIDDNTVKLWDVATGNSNKTLKVSTESVNSVIFSNDSKNLASASDDKTVKLWDVATGNSIKTFKGHTGGVNSVIFSKDGETLASASDDKTVKLWDVATGNSIKTLKGHTGRVSNVIFSNDGKTLASASTDRTVKLWDAATGALIKTFQGHTSKVNSVIFSNDGKTLASVSNDKMVKLWDTTTGNSIKTLRRPSSVKNLSFLTDGKIIRFVSNGDTVRLWDINSGQVSTIASLEASFDYLLDVSISPNSKQIASASSDNTVKLWKRSFQGTPVTLEGHTAEVLSVSFSPNNKILASASSDATIKLWDTSKVKEIKTLKGHSASVNSVRFSPNGEIIASASDDKTVKLWDAKIGKVIKTLERHTNWVNSVSFSPDGKTIASASSDGTVIFWDVAKGSYIKEHKEEATRQTNTDAIDDLSDILDSFEPFNTNENKPPAINSVSFSPDGKTLAFATNDRVVKILDVNSNKILFATPKKHEAKVNSVNFSPDGKIIVSASDSTKNTIGEKQSLNNIKLWDAATGREIITLGKVSDSINSVSFSSDGKTIVSPSNDGTYIVWNFDLDDLLKRGCDQLQRDLHNLKEIDRSNVTDKDRLLCKN